MKWKDPSLKAIAPEYARSIQVSPNGGMSFDEETGIPSKVAGPRPPEFRDIAFEKAKDQALQTGVNYAADQFTTPSLPSGQQGPVQQNPNSAGYIGAGAVGLANAYDQYKKGDRTGAAISGATGGANIAAGLGNQTAASALPYAGVVSGGYNASKILNSNLSEKQKAQAMRQEAENTGAAIGTAGLSSIAQYADQKLLGGKVEKTRDKYEKFVRPESMIQDKVVSKALKMFGGGSSTHWEEKKRQELEKAGIVVPNAGVKEWENNEKFRQSRNEADLTGKDIINAAKFYDITGYDKATPAQRELIANEALKQGLIREHHGGIDVGMNAEYQKFIDSTLAGGGESKPKQGNREPQKKKPQRTKAEKKAALAEIIPELEAPVTQAPRYDFDLSPIYKNPYL